MQVPNGYFLEACQDERVTIGVMVTRYDEDHLTSPSRQRCHDPSACLTTLPISAQNLHFVMNCCINILIGEMTAKNLFTYISEYISLGAIKCCLTTLLLRQ